MKGVILHAPHDLRIEDIATIPPGHGEVRIRIGAGGICGSDLHYYHHGGFGTVRIREPMALGHEISGTIEEIGAGVSHLAIGTRVAVNPSQPCGTCRYCREGLRHQCLNMQFIGSAMRFPHAQGGFRQSLTIRAEQAVPVGDNVSLAEAAMTEPLAVCLHAARQAGPLLGKRVLVTGCGPIGALCVVVARLGGAKEIVVTDVAAGPLATAMKLGADTAIDIAANPEGLAPDCSDKGSFDVLFEASGNERALAGGLDAVRPGGKVVQVGIGSSMTLPMSVIVTKELKLYGTFRFDTEFQLAVELMNRGQVDLKPLVSATLPFEKAVEAFELAADRSRSMKVQLAF
ncbi:L-idonate 5-dehydrogenase [Bosea sp. F3-2]|uniref:L-idonate 5-dehydrogenase n=1 Tax=Bosea sp. F3-2 TaxID=2599640 RepID=UPI0011F03997|nr:L-idonate 5-dehydrogenase [Bosea sp. F3-2]QEL24965.1 L-idonate 5-dehydrogenase [Bosea sp. F3-2]